MEPGPFCWTASFSLFPVFIISPFSILPPALLFQVVPCCCPAPGLLGGTRKPSFYPAWNRNEMPPSQGGLWWPLPSSRRHCSCLIVLRVVTEGPELFAGWLVLRHPIHGCSTPPGSELPRVVLAGSWAGVSPGNCRFCGGFKNVSHFLSPVIWGNSNIYVMGVLGLKKC